VLAYPETPMANDDDDDRSSGQTGAVIRGGLMALGAIAALWLVVFPVLGFGLALLSKALFFGVLAGAGYLGYRMIAGGGRQKAIGGRSRRALPAGRGRKSGGDDFDRKMRELEAIEKRLDAEIGKR
jgi:hypothetical protein